MRVIKKLSESQAYSGRRSVAWLSRILPRWAIVKLMESHFMSFGIETTNICNADCSFCGYRYMERPKVVIEDELYRKAIDEFNASGGGTLNFTPTVGDPLVNKDLVAKIQYAHAKSNIFDIFLYTNGILLDRIGYEALLTSGLSRLAISTYFGDKESYKKIYGKDRYETVVENMLGIARLNQELGHPVRITLHLRVDQDDAWKDLDDYRQIEELVGKENISYLTEYDTWSGLIDEQDLPEGCTVVEPMPLEEKKKSPCFELYRRIHVLADGSVGACVCADLETEIHIGDLKNQTLKQIWKGDALQRYRDTWAGDGMPKVCQGCTRYTPLDDYIEGNRHLIVAQALKKWLTKFKS